MHDHVKIFAAIHPDGILAEDVVGSQYRLVGFRARELHQETTATLGRRLTQDRKGAQPLARSPLLIHEHNRWRRKLAR